MRFTETKTEILYESVALKKRQLQQPGAAVKTLSLLLPRHRSGDRLACCAAHPVCMRQAATPPAATASTHLGLVSALTSLIINSCYRRASDSTSRYRPKAVASMLARASTTGIMRRNSSFMSTDGRGASRTHRQCPANRNLFNQARGVAQTEFFVEAHKPPSEKESGVTLIIPIISGRREARLPNPDSAVDSPFQITR